jgi:hypothetical protein
MPPPAGLEDFPDPAESGPRSGWVLKPSAFPQPVKDRGPKGSIRSSTMQARARRGRGGRGPGALGPRLATDQRSAVAGAMAPAMATALVVRSLSIRPLRAGTGNACVSPARAERCHQDPCHPHQRQASARPGGREAPAVGGAGAGRGLWAPGGPGVSLALWQGRWPLPWQRRWWFGVCRSALSGRAQETHAFPPPARNAATKTRATHTNRGQRPARRARSARRGRGGRWPGALGPRRAWDQRGAVAGAMAPAMAVVNVLSSVRAGTGNALRFPRPRETVPRRSAGPGTAAGQRPTRRARSARRGRGGRWPGALGPRLAKDQPCAVAGAMAPAMAAGLAVRIQIVRAQSGREQETHCVSPARAARFPVDRQVRAHRQASARPGGREAPAGGGAGAGRGLWAPGWPRVSGALWQGRWPLPKGPGIPAWSGTPPLRAGPRNAPRFPRPRGTLPPRSVPPAPTEASARRGRGGRWPGALGPRRARDQRGAVAGTMAPARMRKGAQAEEFPAFRSGSPCGRHFSAPFSRSSLVPCQTCQPTQNARARAASAGPALVR